MTLARPAPVNDYIESQALKQSDFINQEFEKCIKTGILADQAAKANNGEEGGSQKAPTHQPLKSVTDFIGGVLNRADGSRVGPIGGFKALNVPAPVYTW
ncbi:MAG: hypothetical protein M1816_002209 [Peltula sp. TS41687]|nr:MAG: hypothetical protein M1816_002209 [Peltula sp. TS41687]